LVWLLFVIGCEEQKAAVEVTFKENIVTASSPRSTGPIPQHRVTDMWWISEKSLLIYVLAETKLTDAEGLQIAEHYRKKYPDVPIFNLDVLCNPLYSTHKSAKDTADKDYYPFVLYSFASMPDVDKPIQHFWTEQRPFFQGQGKWCSSR